MRTCVGLMLCALAAATSCGSDAAPTSHPDPTPSSPITAGADAARPSEPSATTQAHSPAVPVTTGPATTHVTTHDTQLATTEPARFVATDVTGRDLVPNTSITLEFVGDRQLRISAGCSEMHGEYTIVGGQLAVAGLSRDDIGCDQAMIDQDTWLVDVLLAAPVITRNDDLLVIHAAAATITMVADDIARPDRSLVGTTWVFSGFFDRESAWMPQALVSATITFDASGTYSVDTACNPGSGTFTLDGGVLAVSADSSSGLPCSTDAGLAERELLDVFAGDLRISIDGEAMTLTRHDGHGLVLRAAA